MNDRIKTQSMQTIHPDPKRLQPFRTDPSVETHRTDRTTTDSFENRSCANRSIVSNGRNRTETVPPIQWRGPEPTGNSIRRQTVFRPKSIQFRDNDRVGGRKHDPSSSHIVPGPVGDRSTNGTRTPNTHHPLIYSRTLIASLTVTGTDQSPTPQFLGNVCK
jgi:hypothetical protein